MTRLGLGCVWLASLLWACSAPRVTPDTQGVSVMPGPCGRGLVVVETDYQSSNVSLLDFDGRILSESVLSSRIESAGFGVRLSGDVVTPSSPQDGPDIVLIDRYPAGVLRFVELSSARVMAELSVATGFRSNPQDYLPLGPDRAYVARYESNPNARRQAWDAGGMCWWSTRGCRRSRVESICLRRSPARPSHRNGPEC